MYVRATWDILKVFFSSCTTLNLDTGRFVRTKEHTKSLDLRRNTHVSRAQRGEQQIPMAEVPGSIHTGVSNILLLDFFIFTK